MKIMVVCIGNYCRSPVAHYILKSKLPSSFTISSSGISPYLGMNNMDARSIKYLQTLDISPSIHIPRKLTASDMEENDLILALDLKVLKNIMHKYSKCMHKIKLFTFKNNSVNIKDPFKLKNDDEYNTEMEKIYQTSNKLVKNLTAN